MKKIIKIIVLLLFLVVLAAAVFVYTFDANKYKTEIASVAQALTGRTVTIEGDAEISVYPWIGIKLNNVVIDNGAGFSKQTFARIGQFDINVKIIPLLQKRLDIDKLVLHELSVDFETNLAGEYNWTDLSGSHENQDALGKYGLIGLAIGGINLTDANINWLDVTSGKYFRISKASIETDAVVEGKPLPVTFKAYLESSQPDWQAAVSATAELMFDGEQPVIDINNIKLKSKAILSEEKGGNLSFALVTDGKVNYQDATAKLTNTRFSVFGLIMSGEYDVSNIFSVPTIEGPLKIKSFAAADFVKHFNVEIPPLSNEDSLKNISLVAQFKTDFDAVYFDELSAQVDQSIIRGHVHIDSIANMIVRYKLDMNKLALLDYTKAPAEDAPNVFMLPVDLIRASDVEGSLDIDSLMVGEVELRDFHAESQIANAKLTANPVTTWVNDSEVKAAIQLDAHDKPQGQVLLKVNNVNADASLNPMLVSILGDESLVIEGMLDIDANLKTQGLSIDEHKKSANGLVKIAMKDAVLQGVDADYLSRSVVVDYANRNNFRTRKSYAPEFTPDKRAEVKSLDASFKASNGRFNNKDLKIVLQDFTITGSGSIDFINKKLDYRPVIDVNVEDRVDIRDKLRDHPMEYHVYGDFANLKREFELDKYDLLVGRLLLQESKIRRNKQLNAR
ncbi:MAG: AsmA family protein [Gammaproteobacteria bacterium]|nr:AsmA family protein [Gammaproteobacteria bacterium]